MKNISVAFAALFALSGIALAEPDKKSHGILEPVPVPNGYEVSGCTYKDSTGNQVCDVKSVRQALKDGADPSVSYIGVFTGAGTGGE